jgi:transcriptional regulator with XRE-family HTH domain
MPYDNDPLLIDFGDHLRELRKKQGISQEDFAFQTGLDRTYISGLECGKRNPTLKIIYKLAKSLGIETSDLLNGVYLRGDAKECQR